MLNDMDHDKWLCFQPGVDDSQPESGHPLGGIVHNLPPVGESVVPPPIEITPRTSLSMPFHPRLTVDSLENPYRNAQPSPIHWSVGWADLMMTMFVLFLVLYLYPTAQREQLTKPEQQVAREQVSQHDEFDQPNSLSNQVKQVETGGQPTKVYDLAKIPVEDKEFDKFAKIDLAPDRTVHIVLAADLLFPSGNDNLSPRAKENIKKTATLLNTAHYKINVVGHTDDLPLKGGRFASNWELSVMRATSVARFLIEEMGLPASQFTVSGHSYFDPQCNNDSEANRAKNRRVEIIVSREPSPSVSVAANPALLFEESTND
jgi:chemotaxis protein MotB